jgi:hypothetical protein
VQWSGRGARRLAGKQPSKGKRDASQKSYSGSLQLTLELTPSHGKNKESPMIVIDPLTNKNIEEPAS